MFEMLLGRTRTLRQVGILTPPAANLTVPIVGLEYGPIGITEDIYFVLGRSVNIGYDNKNLWRYTARTNSWLDLGPTPSTLINGGQGILEYMGKVYFFYQRYIHVYNKITGQWTTIPSPVNDGANVFASNKYQGTIYGGVMYFFTTQPSLGKSFIHTYTPETDTWTQMLQLGPGMLYGNTKMITVGDDMYLLGTANTGYQKKITRIHLPTMEESIIDVPFSIGSNPSLVTDGVTINIVCGLVSGSTRDPVSVMNFDPTANALIKKPNLSMPKTDCAVTFNDGLMYLWGGYSTYATTESRVMLATEF